MPLPSITRVRSDVLPQVIDLATETLEVYLNMLQQRWPLEGWVVLQKINDTYSPLTSSGCFMSLCPISGVEKLLYQHWEKAAEYNEYIYRALLEDEVVSLRSQLNDELKAQYLFRVALHNAKGEVVGQLLAACTDLPFYRWSNLCEYVSACVTSMSMMVALLDELGAATVSLAAVENASFYDTESGVLNRAGWIYRLNMLEAAVENHSELQASILVIRLTDRVNYTEQLGVGKVANLIKGLIRREDTVGRIENKAFGIIVKKANPYVAQRLQQNLMNALGCAASEVGVGYACYREGVSVGTRLQLAQARANEAMNGEKVAEPKQAA